VSNEIYELAINLAASRRLTRLITQDEITQPIRDHHAITSHEKISYLLNCPICVGVYTSAAVTLSSILFPKASKPFRYFLALAELQATLTELESQRAALVQDYGPPL
jgi:hypothetical protein